MNRISFLNRGYAFKGLLAVYRVVWQDRYMYIDTWINTNRHENDERVQMIFVCFRLLFWLKD